MGCDEPEKVAVRGSGASNARLAKVSAGEAGQSHLRLYDAALDIIGKLQALVTALNGMAVK